MVAPLCIASRYEDGFKHCVEASVAGAEALRRRKIDARPIPCAVKAVHETEASTLTIGFTRKQLYERMNATAGAASPVRGVADRGGARCAR